MFLIIVLIFSMNIIHYFNLSGKTVYNYPYFKKFFSKNNVRYAKISVKNYHFQMTKK
jgi:hypothetical protein